MEAKIYNGIETRTIKDRQSMAQFFGDYLTDGHQVVEGEEIQFWSFGFHDPTIAGITAELKLYVDNVVAGKKAKKIARNVVNVGYDDMINLENHLTLEQIAELCADLHALAPDMKTAFVLHTMNDKGTNRHLHLHYLRTARTFDGLTTIKEAHRLGLVKGTKAVIRNFYERHNYTISKPHEYETPIKKFEKNYIHNLAMHDTIRAGETDLRTGISRRKKSAVFFRKIAMNVLQGEDIKSDHLRKAALERSNVYLNKRLVHGQKLSTTNPFLEQLSVNAVLMLANKPSKPKTKVKMMQERAMIVNKVDYKKPTSRRREQMLAELEERRRLKTAEKLVAQVQPVKEVSYTPVTESSLEKLRRDLLEQQNSMRKLK